MYEAFVKLLNMGFAGGILVAVIALLRLVFRKAPRRLLCALWILAAVRLVLPFTISSSLSAFNLMDDATVGSGEIEYFSYNGHAEKPKIEIESPLPGIVNAETFQAARPENPLDLLMQTAMHVWAAGAAILLLAACLSCLRIAGQVRPSVPLRENVRVCDEVDSPFIFGLFQPKIYVPSGMDAVTLEHVLTHERAHIARRDHWWKPLGYALLCVYWFNPLIWLGYILLCRDIELACDEKVILDMTKEGRAAYSQALLDCSFPRRTVTACPLAFGEVGVKARIKSVLNYKKPAFWIVLAAVVLCIAAAVCFLTDPKQEKEYAKWDCSVFCVQSSADDEYCITYSSEMPQSDSGVLTFQNRNAFAITIHLTNQKSGEEEVFLIPAGGVTTRYQIERGVEYLIGVHADVPEGAEIRLMVYDGEETETYALNTMAQTPNVERPMLLMNGAYYVDPYKPETMLPAGFSKAGQLSAEQAFNTGLTGTDYFTNPNEPEVFYTYQKCGTAVAIDEVDSMQQQMAYLRWVPIEEEMPGNRKLSLDDVLFLSEKGDDLRRADFDGYVCEDTGSGLYIPCCPIDDVFELRMAGAAGPEQEPKLFLLCNKLSNTQIDIRTQDVRAFIEKGRQQAGSIEILRGTVVEIKDGYLTLQTQEEALQEFRVKIEHMPASPEPQTGDTVEVVYSGLTFDTKAILLAGVSEMRVVEEEERHPAGTLIKRYSDGKDWMEATTLSLYDSGDFVLNPPPYSSYMGVGTYEETDGGLILTTWDDTGIFVFRVKGKKLIYDAAASYSSTFVMENGTVFQKDK